MLGKGGLSDQVCDRGNIITFGSTGGTILNKFFGNRIEFERAGGLYQLRADVREDGSLEPAKGENPQTW